MQVFRKKLDVYIGRNYPREITNLKLNGVIFDFSAQGITKVGIEFDGKEFTSDDDGNYISFSGASIFLRLGGIPNLIPGKFSARIIVYSNNLPAGKPIITEKTSYRLDLNFIA
ncbi:hypothetical protein J7384_17785 [Endozoicomonas sp. G2_1]|uniref:hypothetical protein n=1 Tax=Endozoicomonas sp. G2_1 TaxID=2821091 RepID=UPI001ADB9CA8|nr:hypothetical protein [Endozoicomonas sp. G2_1]MBO9492217.1 hypothetical protein [Endozoicomonas sp. G2_1]